jgi:hypothetical protein
MMDSGERFDATELIMASPGEVIAPVFRKEWEVSWWLFIGGSF